MLREAEECAQNHTARERRGWGIKARLSDSTVRTHSVTGGHWPERPSEGHSRDGLGYGGVLEDMRNKLEGYTGKHVEILGIRCVMGASRGKAGKLAALIDK